MKFFRKLQWRLTAILFLLVICLMIMVGTFLISTIDSTYSNSFISDMQKFESDLEDAQIIADDIVLDDTEYASELFKAFKTYFQIDDTTKKGYLLSPLGEIILPANRVSNDVEITDNIIIAMSGKIGNKVLEEDEYFDYAKPVIMQGEVKYICYLKQGKDTINEISDALKRSIVYVVLVALLVSILISYIISRTITIPVDKLTKSAEKMANGDFTQIKEPESGDEISLLANKFNYMGNRLKNTLSEISQEKGKLETLLQNMSDGVIAFDGEGLLIHANPSAQKMLNISDEILKFEDIFNEFGVDISFEDVMKADNGTFSGQKIELSGKYLNLLIAKVMNTEENNNYGVIVVIQDVTEQEKLEIMRKEFVANVSHELKTPITSIRGYSETLLDSCDDIDKETTRKFLGVINEETERMSRLVSDLLKLSKMDLKNDSENRTNFDVVKLAKQCVDKVYIEAEKKSQELVLFNDENDIIKAFANETDIEQVILNIVSNSIKYTPENGKIGIKIEKVTDGTEIIVKDNGIGIPKEDLPRVFERFYRVDKARSRDMGGTGLGLAIAKNMVESNGGSISIESEQNQGTEVRIKLKSL